MAQLCIPPEIVKGLLEAFRVGDLSLDALQDPTLTSQGRHDMFAKYFPKGQEPVVTWMNGKFEEALLSNKKDAITAWVRQTFKPKDKKTYLDVMDKINKLDKLDALNPNSEYGFMEDLVATKLGVRVTVDEVKEIVARSKKLDELSATLSPLGTYSKEYWKELEKFNDYVDSLSPTHNLRVFTSLIGRGTMLLSAKSPVTNIVSNTVQGATEALNRRISTGQWKGLNNEFWKSYIKEAMNIYNESGYDISRLDKNWLGQKRLGEDVVHSQGPGVTRKIGRWVEDVVFDKLMGTPDAATAILSFSDSANLAITKYVTQVEKLTGNEAAARALELAKEVVHTDVTDASDIAKAIRAEAIANARVATWTNDSGLSWLASGLRTGINKASGDFRLGDQLMPFIKTPANVVSAGLDAAGVGFIKALVKQIQAVRKGDRKLTMEAIRDATTAGTGLALALAIVYGINPEDSTGTFESYGNDQKARDLIKAKNAPYNAILINTPVGKRWVSYDYFGALGPAISGFMAARKAKEGESGAWKYAQSVASQVVKVPGMQEVSDLAGGWSDASTKDFGSFAAETANTIGSFVKSRTIPGIAGDIASMIDPHQREIGTSALNQTMAAIPGVRQLLPEKVGQMTGEEMPNQPWWDTLLFGRRVTTPIDDSVINEVDRLYKTGNGPATGDISKVASVKTMKGQLNDKEYQEAMQYYGSQYGDRVSKLMSSGAEIEGNFIPYASMTDLQKANAINNIREGVMEDMILKHSKSLTPKQQARVNRKKAIALLAISYDTIPDQIWGPIERQYPGLRAESDRQVKMADSGTDSQKAYAKKWFQSYPMALKARKDIASAKTEMRKQYREVEQAYQLIYGR